MTYNPTAVTESKLKGTKIQPKHETVLAPVEDTTKWVAPETAQQLKNPTESNEATKAEGAIVYKKNCRSCHGKDGDGQGAEAADLKTKPTDFRDTNFSKQSDGSMLWKIQKGRGDMTAFEKDLTEDEIWKTINYIRSFSK